MELYRLHPDDQPSWVYYPILEARVVRFTTEHCPDIQTAPLVKEMRDRWVNYPELAGYWIAIENGRVIAHAVAWVGAVWGSVFIHIHQAECYEGYNLREILPLFAQQIEEWRHTLNAAYEKAGDPRRVDAQMELWTFRRPEVFARWWNSIGFEATHTRSVIKIRAIAEPALLRVVGER